MLHALKQMLGDMPADAIAGIACLATPFQHISLRDKRLFDRKRMTRAMIELWGFVVWSLGIFFDWWSTFWIWPVMIIGVFPSALLGAFLGCAIERSREDADTIARLFDGRVPTSTNLLIVRKVGDEASLALGVSQFFSWAMTKAFVLSTMGQQPWRLNLFIYRPTPS